MYFYLYFYNDIFFAFKCVKTLSFNTLQPIEIRISGVAFAKIFTSKSENEGVQKKKPIN